MKKEYNSIFNHALAPITPGPSSSNTCGPVRIGLVCRQLLGETPEKAVVEYYTKGAFPTTLYGMRSDVAFINGLLGKEQNNPEFNDAYQKAAQENMAVSFAAVDDLTVGGMETVRIRMTAHDGSLLTVVGESVGGGAFRIHFIDDCPVDIRGMNYELLLFVKQNKQAVQSLAEELSGEVKKLNDTSISEGKSYCIINLKAARPFEEDWLKKLMKRHEVDHVRVVNPVHPIVADFTRTPPFECPRQMISYCEKKHCMLSQAAIDYEMAISGWSEEEIRRYGEMLLQIMSESRASGLRPDLKFEGIVKPKAALLQGQIGQGQMPSLGLLDRAIPYALGIMEHSNASGKIVCVPTGGSSGIVPGLLLAAYESLNATKDMLYQSLMAAGIIGVMMMVDGNEPPVLFRADL